MLSTDLQDSLAPAHPEAAMVAAGVERYLDQQSKLVKKGQAVAAPDYHDLMCQHILALADKIEEVREQNKAARGPRSRYLRLIEGIPSATIAYLCLANVFNSVARSETSRVRVAAGIGSSLWTEAHYHFIQTANEQLWETLRRYAMQRNSPHFQRYYVVKNARRHGIDFQSWPTATRLLLGVFLLRMMEKQEIIAIDKVTKDNHTDTFVHLAEPVMQWLTRRRELAERGDLNLIRPVWCPMVTQPRDWTTPYNGGYETVRLPLVKAGAAELKDADLSRVFAAINSMQRVAWRVNKPMLDIVQQLWRGGVSVGSLPRAQRREVPNTLPDEVWSEMSDDAKKAHRQMLRTIHEDNRKALSDLVAISQVLGQADELKDEDRFYIPYQLDWRGRVYAVPLFNQQGPDYVRSLFEFANGKPCGERGGMWLAIQCASLWDGEYRGGKLSKASFQDRHDWSEENEGFLRSIVANPLRDTRWHDADKPFMFLRTAMDYIGFLDNGPSFVSTIPIALDGSCSGIQHYSALLRDPVGAASVNLLPSETPADVYGDVAKALLEEVQNDAASPERDFWLAEGINRKTCKKPVMTYGYSSRLPGFTEWYESEFVRPAFRERKLQEQSGPFARYLARKTLRAVEKRLKAVATGMEWMIECARLLAHEGKPVTWMAPSGFPVVQKYMKMETQPVMLRLQGEVLKVKVSTESDTISKEKQKSAISPCFIHSLDAAHLVAVVLRAKEYGVDNFALIHDSFGTLPADTDIMFSATREAFVEMYEQNDPFQHLYEQCFEALSEEGRAQLPPPPPKGDLEIASVLESLYAFA